MPLKCFNKPNRSRKRTFDAKAVARIYCTAVEDGEDQDEIDRLIEECMNDGKKRVRDCNCSQLYSLIRNSMIAIAAVGATILALRALPQILSALPRLLLPAAVRAGLLQLPRATRIIEGEFTVLKGALERAGQLTSKQEKLTITIIGGGK